MFICRSVTFQIIENKVFFFYFCFFLISFLISPGLFSPKNLTSGLSWYHGWKVESILQQFLSVPLILILSFILVFLNLASCYFFVGAPIWHIINVFDIDVFVNLYFLILNLISIFQLLIFKNNISLIKFYKITE